MGLLSHEFRSCLVTSSSAMEALGSPSISRVPMGGGHAFRIPKTNVCQWQVQRQYTIVHYREVHFTASGFFLKIFYRLCVFVFVSFWSFFFFFFFFFFASLNFMKCRKKNQHKNNNNLQTGRTNTLLCRSCFSFVFFFFWLSRKKSVKSMCYLKSTSKGTLCTKRIMLSL